LPNGTLAGYLEPKIPNKAQRNGIMLNHKKTLMIDNEEYQLTTILFPINKMSLKKGELMICHDLFPKLKRYSLISFTLSSIKRIALMLGLAIS
jgi:hypothetical protein